MENKNFRIKIFNNLEELGDHIANIVFNLYKQKGKLVLGVPWGSTPVPFFNSFSTLVNRHNTDLSQMHLVMMDEYVSKNNNGYSFANQNASYCGHYRLKVDFLEKLPSKEAQNIQIHFPFPNDPKSFETFIKNLGGIDLFLVATGAEDGHVAMCGPGTPLESITRIVEIDETVRNYNFKKYNHDFLNDRNNVPTYGVSIGLGTILDAKKLLFVAHGTEKAHIVEILLQAKKFNKIYPVTFLWEAVEKSEILIDKAVTQNIIGLIQGE